MKRDMNLARQILLVLEQCADCDGSRTVDIQISGHTPWELSYHVALLHEAGLIEARNRSCPGGEDWRPTRLTWVGHEFLAAARKESLWHKAQRIVVEKTGGLNFNLLNQVLFRLGTDALTGP
jgi:hypothetical protein